MVSHRSIIYLAQSKKSAIGAMSDLFAIYYEIIELY